MAIGEILLVCETEFTLWDSHIESNKSWSLWTHSDVCEEMKFIWRKLRILRGVDKEIPYSGIRFIEVCGLRHGVSQWTVNHGGINCDDIKTRFFILEKIPH
jgi:hypothetical protein